jgi:phage tail sheath protein FI
VTFRHNAKGWVVWGNNTSAYPGNTDPKDRFIPIRRVFQYVKNDFLVFGEPRIDNPINKRQLEGVLNSYNMRLQGFTGAGMVNSASVALDADLNTPANLLDGRVFIRTLISPPPPMEQLSNVFEYDVAGFTDSLS